MGGVIWFVAGFVTCLVCVGAFGFVLVRRDEAKKRALTQHYHEHPEEILGHAETLVGWLHRHPVGQIVAAQRERVGKTLQ